MECKPLSALLWNLAEHSLRLSQDSLFKTLHVAWNVFWCQYVFRRLLNVVMKSKKKSVTLGNAQVFEPNVET